MSGNQINLKEMVERKKKKKESFQPKKTLKINKETNMEKTNSNTSKQILFGLICAIGGALLLWIVPSLTRGSVLSSSSDYKEIENEDSYKAVFLTNGQVYFGKIIKKNELEIHIEDIYYLQVNQNLQSGENEEKTNDPELSLIKLGKELHGPTDKMRINRSQVLFTEDLKDDSKVLEAIKDYKQ